MARNDSLRITVMLGLAVGVMTMTPRICQTQRNGHFYHLNSIQQCNNLQVTEVTAEIEIANVESYKTDAKGILVQNKICDTYDDFFGEKSQQKYTKNIIVPEHQAKEMIRERKCLSPDGSFRFSNFNKNHACKYSYLKAQRETTSTCFFYDGFVQATHSGVMSSSITDVSGCSYTNGFCQSAATSVMWSPSDKIVDDYVNKLTLNCSKIQSHLICDSVAKSYDLDKFTFDETSNAFVNGLWRIKIINEQKSPKMKVSAFLNAESDIGKQIEALKSEIHARFQYLVDWYNSPQGRLNTICISLLQINKLTKSSLRYHATTFAQLASNNSNIVAKATPNYLAIWPCRALQQSDFNFQKLEDCYNMIPIQLKNKTGFLDENMIFHETAVKINCKKSPIKLFEMLGNLYIQRENHLPFKVKLDNFSTISFLNDFNFTDMPSLPEKWEVSPEYFDVSTGLFDNMKERLEDATNKEVDRSQNEGILDKLNIFGIRGLSPFGFIDAIITWISRCGSFIAFYLLLKDQCQNNNGFRFLRRRNGNEE